MNKFGVISLSVLGTLGISAGAVAILNTAPGTKGKLNISYGDNQIVGENKPGNSFEDGLAQMKYIQVGYKNGENVSFHLQRAGSLVNYEDIGLEDKDGNVLIGFVNQDGESVLFPKNGDILTPVFVDPDIMVNYVTCSDLATGSEHTITGTASSLAIFNNPFGNYNGLEERILGLSSSADEIVPVTEIKQDETYYLIYLLEPANIICTLNDVSIEANKYWYGENCYSTANFVGLEATKECVIKDCLNEFSSINVSSTVYSVLGFATSPDSIDLVDLKNIIPDETYYAVYVGGMAGDIIKSLNDIKELAEVIIIGQNSEITLAQFEDLATLSLDSIYVDRVNLTFAGFADSAESTIAIESKNLTEEFLGNAGITTLYALYTRADNGEVYNVADLTQVAQMVAYRDSSRVRTAVNVVFIDKYEVDVKVGMDYYFIGWSLSEDSTEVVEEYPSDAILYAVYGTPAGEFYTANQVGTI